MLRTLRWPLWWASVAWTATAVAATCPQHPVPTDPDPAYTRVIEQRAAKIVERLGLTDPAQSRRVLEIIADQYRSLSRLHDTCDAELQAIAADPNLGEPARAAAEQAVRRLVQSLQDQLHRRYLIKLAAHLSAEQIDQVKDGMTYGVMDVTYRSFLELLPELTETQKQVIREMLCEAREIAMDAGSSKEKHGWFGKYKGRINNYLAAQGYDLKAASRRRNARNQSR